MRLVAAATDLTALHDELFAAYPDEAAAFLSVVPQNDTLALRAFRVFHAHEVERSGGGVSILEEVKVREIAKLKKAGLALVDAHTHPDVDQGVRFSFFDEEQLPDFARYIGHKLMNLPFGALVFGRHSYFGSVWRRGRREQLTIDPVGQVASIPQWLDSEQSHGVDLTTALVYDRQIRALGAEGQSRLAALSVGVVGLGGTGSLVAHQLARLGVHELLIVDDDRVDRTNLPRLAGSTWWDPLLRSNKNRVAAREIRRFNRHVRVLRFASLRASATLRALANVDLIVGCVDNDGARLVLSELAAAFVKPYLDIGVSIEPTSRGPVMGGRVSFYVPGGPCLGCMDELDFVEASEDLESEVHYALRKQRGYSSDRGVEPALMPLNTMLAGAALLEFLAYFTGFRAVRTFFRFNVAENRITEQRGVRNADCPVCAPAYGMGDRHGIERYSLS